MTADTGIPMGEMMVTRALEKYLRISSKKLNPIAGLIRKQKVEDAIYLLINTNKKGALILKKVVESALSNAKRIPEKHYTEENLFISRVTVNGGPMLKRYRSMSMGRAGTIRKRTSHVLVELAEREGALPKRKAVGKKPQKKTFFGRKPAKARK